jgi:hypothetical protein
LKQTILHIGLEKTGTTSIQFLFRQNREELLKSSILVSNGSTSGNSFRLAVASYSKFRADGLTRQLSIGSEAELQKFRQATIEALAAEIKSTAPEKVILSSEHFQSRLLGTDDIALLKSLLEEAGCKNFRVLVYLRDPLKIAMSHHGMAIKKGVHVTQEFYRPEHRRISHIIDHKKTLSNWAAVFGESNLDVRLYPEGQSGDVLIADFLGAVGVGPNQLDLSKQELRNVNLNALALEVLNRVNAKSDRVRLLSEDRWLFNRLEQEFAGRGLSPTAEVIELFAEHYSADHRQISKRWFDSQTPLFVSSYQVEGASSSQEQAEVAAAIDKLIARAILRRRLLALPRKLGLIGKR